MSEPTTPKRVLHLHSGNMMGGIESLLLTIAESAQLTPDTRHEFALTFDDKFAALLRSKSASVHLLPEVRLRHLPSIYQSRRQLRMLLRQSRFDAVISHSSWIQLIFADVVREFSIPLVFWMHGPCDGHWLQKLASFQRPDFVICNSHYTRSTLDRCYSEVKSAVVYGPVPKREPRQSRDEIRAELGLMPHEVAILIAARMETWKGHLDLLRALSEITAPWKLLIAGAPNSGEEDYFQLLQREAAGLVTAGRVQFLGYRSDVVALIAAADVYCQPNQKPEPFGVVYVEALHAGVPVVTSAMGGAREILDRSTGILVEADNREALTAALSRLVDSRSLRVRLGNAGPARATEICDPARQMRRLSELIQSVVDRKGTGAS